MMKKVSGIEAFTHQTSRTKLSNIKAPRSSVDALAPQFQRKDAFTSCFKRKSVDALNPPYQHVEALAPWYRRVEVFAPDRFNGNNRFRSSTAMQC